MHSLELFAAKTRSLQVTNFPLRHWSPFQKKHSSFEPIPTEVSILEVKLWPILKFLKKLKIFQKWFGVHSFEHFVAYTRSFQEKRLSSKNLVTISEEA